MDAQPLLANLLTVCVLGFVSWFFSPLTRPGNPGGR